MGGSGVQRPLKFIKYLREYGWNPIIVCPEPGMYPYFDESLEKELQAINPEVHRVKPDTIFHKGTAGGSAKKRKYPEALVKIARRILRLFMFPDNKKGWINPAVQKASEIIEDKNIEAIFSTAPPFSNHIVGKKLKDLFGIPLVLDYRDAWLNNHFMDDMFGWQKKIMRNMEQSCLERADRVLGLDDFMIENMKEAYGKAVPESTVIPHGFDPQDFENSNEPSLNYKDGKLNFLYSGLFYESNQPDIFLKAIKKAFERNLLNTEEIHLHFQGGLDERINKLIDRLGLMSNVSDYGYLHHDIAVSNLLKADVLWMISDFNSKHKQVKSGKLFEYIGTGKPILGILRNGQAKSLLKKYGAGYTCDPDDVDGLVLVLKNMYEKWKTSNDGFSEADKSYITHYDRRLITGKLAKIFDEISTQ